jgi:hypothetical protein
MPLVDPAHFEGEDTVRVYVARRLGEAREVERVLSELGADYTVAPDRVVERLLGVLPREYDAVAFRVLATDAEASRAALWENGLHAGLVDDE